MKLSTRGRYAVMAMTDLAHKSRKYIDAQMEEQDAVRAVAVPPVSLADISARQEISLSYLEQIFQDLRKAGLVESVRGPKGGYRLAKAPAETLVGDIIVSVDEQVETTRCTKSGPCLSPHTRCMTHDLWAELGAQIHGFLNRVSLADVINGAVPVANDVRDREIASDEKTLPAHITSDRIFLDYNATTPIYPAVADLMADILANGGNASSVHGAGRAARAVLETARQQVSALVGGTLAGTIFTSGGTEACNLALQTRNAPAGKIERLIIGAIEHPAVLESAKASGLPISIIPVNKQGVVDMTALAKALQDERPALVAIMAANNETGVQQPIAEIGKKVRAHGSVFFCDGVQAAGKMLLDMARMNIDLLALSAHKIGGATGVGALVVAPHVVVAVQQLGGGQELRRRAGTENLSGIAGFGLAAELTVQNLSSHNANMVKMRDALEAGLQAHNPHIHFFGHDAPRLANTSCFAVSDSATAETLVMALDLEGIAVSAGSACSSGKITPSHVLEAMGVDSDLARRAIRVSFGRNNHMGDVEKLIAAFLRITARRIEAAE